MKSMMFKDDVHVRISLFLCQKIAHKFIYLQVITDPVKSVTLYY